MLDVELSILAALLLLNAMDSSVASAPVHPGPDISVSGLLHETPPLTTREIPPSVASLDQLAPPQEGSRRDSSPTTPSPESQAPDVDEPPVQDPIAIEETVQDAPDPALLSSTLTILEIDERLPTPSDVAAVVESAAGAVVQRFGGLGDFSAVSLRGSSLRQVQVYLDGVPLNPDGSSVVNLSELPLQSFSRVEIFRGNVPARFGAAPMGGVVNLVSGSGRGEASGASVSYGTYRTLWLNARTSASGTLGQARTDVLVAADRFSTNGDFVYFSDNGTIFNLTDDRLLRRGNNEKSQLALHGRWRLRGENWSIHVLNAFLDRSEGVPGNTNTPAELARLDTLRNVSIVQLESRTGEVRRRARLWSHLRRERYDDRASELGVGAQHLENTFSSLGVFASASWLPTTTLLLDGSIQLRRDGFRSRDLLDETDSGLNVRYEATGALGATWSLWRGRLEASPVLQARWLDNTAGADVWLVDAPEANSGDNSLQRVDPRLGLLAHLLPGLVLKANGGRYLRPPDFTELFGDRGAVVGNPDLEPESGTQWDIGARWTLPEAIPTGLTGWVQAMHFWNPTTDRIGYVQGSEQISRAENLGPSQTRGVETEVLLALDDWLTFDGSLGYTHSESRSDDPNHYGKQLPRVPTWRYHLGFSGQWRGLARAGYSFNFMDGNYWDRTNWYRAAPRAIHNLFLRARPLEGWPWLELGVLNLTNRIAEVVPRDPLSTNDDTDRVQAVTDFSGYPLAGRTFMLTIRWE